MTIDDALERFLVQLEADGRSPHTTGQYRRHSEEDCERHAAMIQAN